MRMFWISAGLTALGLGAVGLVLPLLPTVPFLILAAFCFARSSERLHNWLLSHPVMGPPIEAWERSGAISPNGKWLATLSMAGSVAVAALLGLSPVVLAVQTAVLTATGVFIWTRPSA